MKYLKSFNESYEYFSLTDKYKQLPDDVLSQRNNNNDWLIRTPNHIKLLSLLSNGIDFNISEHFELDDNFFDALENEYEYFGFELTRNEVKDAVYKLKEQGYLK